MDDYISRKQAIDELTKNKKALEHIINGMSGYEKEFDRLVGQRNQVDYDIYAIRQLSFAQPRGKYILHTYLPHHNYCSICEKDSPYNKRWNFCPNCGADMRED